MLSEEARVLMAGDRWEAYGDPKVQFDRLATFWSGVMGTEVTPRQVCLCLMLMKVSREIHSPRLDNRVDLVAYTEMLQEL